jgi:hypothetical protein
MGKNDKSFYEAPSFQVFEIRTEGMICQSQNTMNDRNSYDTTDDNPFA